MSVAWKIGASYGAGRRYCPAGRRVASWLITAAALLMAFLMPALAATPVANDDAYSTPLDTALIIPAPGILANDTDADGDSLTATNVVVFGPGSFSVNGLSGAVTYNPPVGFTGVARMTYQVTDGTTTSGAATVLVAV